MVTGGLDRIEPFGKNYLLLEPVQLNVQATGIPIRRGKEELESAKLGN